MLLSLITAVHVFVCIMLILIVLLQQGKGADMGATFGGGTNTLFGASGADNLLSRVTTMTALVFMCTSVTLAAHTRPGSVATGDIFKEMPTGAPKAPVAAEPGVPVEAGGSGAPAKADSAPGTTTGTTTDGAVGTTPADETPISELPQGKIPADSLRPQAATPGTPVTAAAPGPIPEQTAPTGFGSESAPGLVPGGDGQPKDAAANGGSAAK